MIVGHLVGDQLFGAERSLLELLAAVDRTIFDLSCVFPSGNDEYLRAVAQYTNNITVFPYQWSRPSSTVDMRSSTPGSRSGGRRRHRDGEALRRSLEAEPAPA